MSLPAQHRMGTPVAPPRVTLREQPEPGPQVPIRIRLGGLVALGGAVLTDDLTSPPLRQAEPFLEHVYGSAAPRRAYQFPLAISRSARFSSSLSATIRFSAAFSRSSSRSRFASSAFMPPY